MWGGWVICALVFEFLLCFVLGNGKFKRRSFVSHVTQSSSFLYRRFHPQHLFFSLQHPDIFARGLFLLSAHKQIQDQRHSAHTETHNINKDFNLCVYAKPAFAIQTSRPQPITTNPITFYMQHLISRKGYLDLSEQYSDLSKHMWTIVCACVYGCACVCVYVFADLQVILWLAPRHVWLAACRFHHIAPETETDLVASHPQVSLSLSLSLSLPLSLFPCWLTLVSSGRPSCGEALWLKRQNKSSYCHLWSSCPVHEFLPLSLSVLYTHTHTHARR